MEENMVISEEIQAEPQRYFYAQLDSENICCGLSDLSGEVAQDNMILLETYDVTVLGKKYENGVWVEVEQPIPEPEEVQPTNAELKELVLAVQEQNLILMEAMAEMYEQQATV